MAQDTTATVENTNTGEKRQQMCNIMVQFTIVEDEEGLAVKKEIDKAVCNLSNVRINFSILQQRAIMP